MKTSVLFRVACAILGLAAAPVIAQTQSSAAASAGGHVQTSKLIGTKVKTAQGEEIGVIKDIVLDRSNGCMAYTVLSTGGTATRTTGQAKTVAVPWAVYSPASDLSVLTVSVDRDRIYNAPVFDYARIDEYATSGYINNVYSYYGVSAQAGVTGQTTVTGGATTTAATASPMATASPAATSAGAAGTASPAVTGSPRGTARPHATASASPRATAAASPYGGATASPSPRATRRPRDGASVTPPSSGRGETASPSVTEGSSEATGSPGETKKSRRHATEGRPKSAPSETPESPEEQE